MKKFSRGFFWGCDHFPYSHQDRMDFLAECKREIKPDFVTHCGDEIDGHAISMHEPDVDLRSAGDEFELAKAAILKLEKLFPRLDIVESNHGSLMFRRAKKFGLPRSYLKSYNEIYGVGKGWQWHMDLIVTPSQGPDIYVTHGKSANVLALSQAMGMSVIQAHFHEKHGVQYWGNPRDLYFAGQVGCGIDWKHLAMAYAKNNMKRPVLGALKVIDGVASPIPMRLDKHGRWTGKL
jgi:hypothetical protein